MNKLIPILLFLLLSLTPSFSQENSSPAIKLNCAPMSQVVTILKNNNFKPMFAGTIGEGVDTVLYSNSDGKFIQFIVIKLEPDSAYCEIAKGKNFTYQIPGIKS